MNYIEIINNYWQLREQGILDAGCGDLYLYLVHKSNSLGWKNPFNQTNGLICSIITVSEPTLIRQRNVLKQIGLIDFESGKALRQPTQYYLNDFSSVVSGGVSSDFSKRFSRGDEKPLDNTKQETKPNKTKQMQPAPEKIYIQANHESFQSRFFEDQASVEAAHMMFRVEIEKLKALAADFNLFLGGKSKKHLTMSAWQDHFINWLKKQDLYAKPGNTRQPNSTDAIAEAATRILAGDQREG